MSDWMDDSVVSNQTQLHYNRRNGSGPALVLLHGISHDGLCWTPDAEALEDRFDVIMVDLRGHGKSGAPD
jgi:N-formylmaleamate deformylase